MLNWEQQSKRGQIMKKQKSSQEKKEKKHYEKPLLTRHQKLTSITGGTFGSGPVDLGCTRS
jgi:hypothetical protein